MATKLRNFSTNSITQKSAYIVLILLITSVIINLSIARFKQIRLETVVESNYKNSEEYSQNLNEIFANISFFIQNSKVDAEVEDSDGFISYSRVDNYEAYLNMKNESNSYSSVKSAYGELKFYFYAENENKTFYNNNQASRDFYEGNGNEFYAYENGRWTTGVNTQKSNILNWFGFDEKTTVYISLTDDSIAQIQTQWETERKMAVPMVINIIVQVSVGCFAFLFLLCVTGRKPNDRKVHLSKIDKIYSDVSVGLVAWVAWFYAAGLSVLLSSASYAYSEISLRVIFTFIMCGVFTIVCGSLCLSLFLSIVRKTKAGTVLKHTLIFTILYKIYDFMRSFFDGRQFRNFPLTKSLFYRQALFIAASGFLVFLTFFFLLYARQLPGFVFIPPILEIVLIYWYIKGNNETFAKINKGFNESLEEQMRAERMKIALVTNVSHDLKTPLTSIISYIDLLSKEFKEQNFTNINDYIAILADKSDRLKNIVSDLFDLAKSTSGNIELQFERLDMKKLVEQTLADMSDKIEKTDLQMKVRLTQAPLYVYSDGKKLYRILQNIIDNAIKYSLVGTRVFIDLHADSNKAVVSVTNTSAYEMDFTAEEVLARFNRGDKSRSTEGSGLGLSIAESFTNACGGRFSVVIDGDQFKVVIELNLSE